MGSECVRCLNAMATSRDPHVRCAGRLGARTSKCHKCQEGNRSARECQVVSAARRRCYPVARPLLTLCPSPKQPPAEAREAADTMALAAMALRTSNDRHAKKHSGVRLFLLSRPAPRPLRIVC